MLTLHITTNITGLAASLLACVCVCRGQAGWVEWIIEVLMWMSSVIVVPLRSGGSLTVMDLI